MKLKRFVFLMLIYVGFAMTMAAQTTTPVSSLPYYCGFENAQENANWTLNRRGGIGASNPLPSQWTIGTGAKHSGFNGLYISTGDQPDAAEYDGSREVFVVAEREFNLQPGSYDISFDWRCLGDANSDAIFVYWVPATTTLTSRTTSTLPTNATPLTIGTTNYFSGAASWTQVRSTVTVSSAQRYRLVFAWRNNTTNTYNPGGCLDNVQVNTHEVAADCWHSVSNLTWTQGATADVLSWNGPAGATYDIYYWMEGDFRIDSIMGVSGNSYTFNHGVLNSGLYGFSVRTNCGTDQSLQIELLKVKSLGDYTMVAEACPDVDLIANEVIGNEKFLRPMCDESGTFRVKPQTVAGGGSIAGYRVDAIEYTECPFPFDYALAAAMMGAAGSGNYLRRISTDDVWDSQILTLPFKVCFFEGTYAQAVVCSNGIVSFDTQVAGKSAGYSLTGQPDIPSPDFGQAQGNGYYWRNAIYGVFQDYDPYYGGEIWYGVLGEWPCRKMVVCWNEVPMFNNHTTLNSSMIVMYEGTNVIDVYVKNRDLSPSGWNDNRGIIGLQNADGSDGVAAPGRNTSDGDNSGRGWSARREAWRFSPYSTPAYALTWYKGSFASPEAVDAYIAEHPNENIEITVADSLSIGKDDGIDAVTVRLQYSQCNGDYIDIIDHARIEWPTTDTIVVDTFTCAGRPYNDRYVNQATSTGVYDVIIPNSHGCDSIFYRLNLKVLEKDTVSFDTTFCSGGVLDYGGLHISEPGVYPVALKYAGCDCDSLIQIVTLNTLEPLHVSIQNDQTAVCADDPVISLSYSVVSGKADKYNVVFDANAHAAGFVDLMDQQVEDAAEINIPIMQEGDQAFKRPGTYNATLTFFDKSECTDQSYDIQFDVLYPSSIIFQRWDDVLSVTGPQYNGGYEFTAYQWLKNGQLLDKEVRSYYYAPDKLDLTAEYQVLLTDMDGNQIISCPFVPLPNVAPVSVAPTTVRVGGQVLITVPEESQVDFYNVSGFRMNATSVETGSTMVTVPSTAGVYIIHLSMAEGTRSFRITVTE